MCLIDNINFVRQQKRMTENEMCIKAHMSMRTFYDRKKAPDTFRLGEIEKISKVLGVSSKNLLFGRLAFLQD